MSNNLTHVSEGIVYVSGIYKGGSGTPCTQKHTSSTCTRTPILHVRKTRPAYIHNYPNSACTQNTFFCTGKFRPKWIPRYSHASPREDGPYSLAGLGVRHSTEGSQGYSHVSPREDGPNNLAGLGRDTPPRAPKGSQGTATSRPERTAHTICRPRGETTHRGLPGFSKGSATSHLRGRPSFLRRPRGETIHLARKNNFGLRAPSYRSEDGLAGLGVRRGTRLSNAKTFVYG